MGRLLDRLQEYEYRTKRKYSRQFASLANGQAPLAMLVTCADSRIVPSIIATSSPGELFVVRNIANLVPIACSDVDPSVPAAIDYAVEVLGVHDIIVCGHSNCGGIRALLDGAPEGHLRRWLEHARPALERWKSERAPAGRTDASTRPDYDQLSQVSTLLQLENLLTYPEVKARVDAGTLRLHPWWFDIGAGALLAHWEGAFIPAVDVLERIERAEDSKPVLVQSGDAGASSLALDGGPA